MGRGARSIAAMALIGVLATALAACGGEDESFDEREIVKALKLERPDEGKGYLLDGDPFCVLSDRFFEGSTEVNAAVDDEDAGVVVSSRAGNVAVEGFPELFGPDCKQRARKRLDKLDPPATDE